VPSRRPVRLRRRCAVHRRDDQGRVERGADAGWGPNLGVPESCLPDWGRDVALEERVWEDTLRPRKDLAGRSMWEKLTDYFAARWKFRLAYPESLFVNFRHGWASIRVKYLPGSRSVWR